MSKSKIIIIVISMLIAGFAIGFFTAGRMAGMRIEKHRNMMQSIALEKAFISKRLGLSAEQEEVVFPLLDSMLTVQKSIREEHHTQMKSERNKMFESIGPNLTPEQLEKLKKFNRRGRPPGPPPR